MEGGGFGGGEGEAGVDVRVRWARGWRWARGRGGRVRRGWGSSVAARLGHGAAQESASRSKSGWLGLGFQEKRMVRVRVPMERSMGVDGAGLGFPWGGAHRCTGIILR